jgi:YVTN family beta-propeller protein
VSLVAGQLAARALCGARAAVVSALVAAAAACWVACGGPPSPVLYVAVAGNNCVRVIDPATGATLRRIYAGGTPWRLVPSPDGRRLWVQHWGAGSTAVVDLADHEIVRLLPFRGPGAFDSAGARFLTFDWPGSTLAWVEAQTLEIQGQEATGVRQVYDVAPHPDGATLHLVQHDPMTRRPRPRYAYVLAYPAPPAGAAGEAEAARGEPLSLPTGRSPIAVRRVPGQPFLLTADSETNGLTLLNDLGDGRAVPTCAAPRAIVLAPHAARLVVLCWRGEPERRSAAVSYRADFTRRPWPELRQEAAVALDGALAAGAFAPDGGAVYAADRLGGRLLELDPATLAVRRAIPTGDVPVDVVALTLPARARERLASPGEARRQVLAALAQPHGKEGGAPSALRGRALAWTELTRGLAPEKEDAGAGRAAGAPSPVRRARVRLLPPDRLRVEQEGGGVRLAAGGHAVAVDRSGRFRLTPRQELLSLVLALPGVAPATAVRLLAGDVPGSPWLRGGLAVDAAAAVQEGRETRLLVGATRDDEPVSQLWLDAASGRPVLLRERFPVFAAGGHAAPAFGGLVETRFDRFAALAGGLFLPRRLERTLDGRARQEVRLEGAHMEPAAPALFDLARLGGVAPARAGGPPTSGASAPDLVTWGVHPLPIPPEVLLHNLEHGGVALLYNCPDGCPRLVAELAALARSRDHLLVAPYPLMAPRLALVAWERLATRETFDRSAVLAFIAAYAGRDRHTATTPSLAGSRGGD